MSEEITQLSIKELLNGGVDYLIPMYQRNYAWDEGEITQLIQDVIDYQPKGHDYYIGTLVVFERKSDGRTVYETIDGQQRITTLSLLASYLKHDTDFDMSWYQRLEIRFESREHSRRTFDAIFEGDFKDDLSQRLHGKEINAAILNGYQLIRKLLPQKLKEHDVSPYDFSKYLFDKVQIMRVKVPEDTDLNHYFEIMNNRGEQLEKHEVLKSRLMEVLNDIVDDNEREESQSCLHKVWEACANMEKYVQLGFSVEQRNVLFGEKDWGQFHVGDFDELREALRGSGDRSFLEEEAQSLDQIIATVASGKTKDDREDEAPERFHTVINFPNFLLHVLRVVTAQDTPLDDIVPLDDKRLITTFESELLKSEDAIAKVKRFTFSLLRCKYLFDTYVIKREFIKGADRWSLKRFQWNDGGARNRSGRGGYINTFGEESGDDGYNRRILMLLSAFHVSTPTLVYKHWLNAALFWLLGTEKIEAKAYLLYLESVAKAFVFDRFLATGEGAEYFDMIFRNKGVCQAHFSSFSDELLESRLSFGQIENNFIFNYLDYLLWLKYKDEDGVVRAYEFSFRSSVEHYYPQHPMPGHDPLPAESLNSFGNLCLISHSKNSRLSNFMPQAKKEYYRNNTIDSVKQHLMIKYERWDKQSIDEHDKAMKEVLLGVLKGSPEGCLIQDTVKEIIDE